MTDLINRFLVFHPKRFRAGGAALALLALTSIHHAYGAFAFGTPWRLHILAIAVPVAIAIVVALHCSAVRPSRLAGQRLAVFAAGLILAFPVGAIGIYEGGYNHVLKNLIYFIGGEAQARALFPSPLYEMPRDVFFEATGIAQFPLAIATAVLTPQLFRRPAGTMSCLAPGQRVPLRRIATISGEAIDLADGRWLTHLQFRRFAGCPVCNLHLRSFVRRRDELKAVLREVIVFHSLGGDRGSWRRDNFPSGRRTRKGALPSVRRRGGRPRAPQPQSLAGDPARHRGCAARCHPPAPAHAAALA